MGPTGSGGLVVVVEVEVLEGTPPPGDATFDKI
jgi:hypothetical protein